MFGFFFNLLNEYYFNKRYYFYYLVIKKNNDFDKNKLKYQIKDFLPISHFSNINNKVDKISFDIHKLEPIIKDLDKFWYNSNNSQKIDKNEFYKKQYLKFYNKAFSKYNELDYFKTAITLFEEVRNKNILEKKVFDKDNEVYIPVDIKFRFFQFQKR